MADIFRHTRLKYVVESYFTLILLTALMVTHLFVKTYAYKIPLAKVISIARNKKVVTVKFYNEADEPVEAKLRNVSEADYEILAGQPEVIARRNDAAI